MELIPTRQKQKLAKGTSYPFGALEASEHLIDCPQFQKFELGFFAERSRHNLIKTDNTVVIDVRRSMPFWSFSIYPILSERKHEFRNYMIQKGWSMLSDWLSRTWFSNGMKGGAHITIYFKYSDKRIDAVEGKLTQPIKSQ